MNTERQPTLTIIGSMAGSILVSTIAITTLIVLQHGAMRSDIRDQHAAMRGDIREIRGDVDELRERMARIEVLVERGAANRAAPAAQ